jgi:hypothetical protein
MDMESLEPDGALRFVLLIEALDAHFPILQSSIKGMSNEHSFNIFTKKPTF